MTQVMVARPEPQEKRKDEISVSVIVPCRNEGGNVRQAVEQIPNMGSETRLSFAMTNRPTIPSLKFAGCRPSIRNGGFSF